MNKQQIINELQADNMGLAYNQSGIPIQVMTFREFLAWYADAGHERISIVIEDVNMREDEDSDLMCYHTVITRSAADSRRIFHRERFATPDEAEAEYYAILERHYNDDNGAGGIWYPASEALPAIESGQYDEYLEPAEC